jgi:antitoxin (DNA-binding transcriptional repressor) of toxin-antitoxin stability system
MKSRSNTVNMFEAKSQLSRLVQAVESGEVEEIIIARNGRAAARLAPLRAAPAAKRLGLLAGRLRAPTLEEINAGNDEIEAAFRGEAPAPR